jgi:hypothetical protein
MPSLGSLLRELESAFSIRTGVSSFSALLLLLLFVGGLQAAFLKEEVT